MFIFFKNVSACKFMEIPPKEIRPLKIIALTFKFSPQVLRSKQPRVSSIIPFKTEVTTLTFKFGEIFDKTKVIGKNKLKWLKIVINIKNIAIYPPTIKMLLIELNMQFSKMFSVCVAETLLGFIFFSVFSIYFL